MRILKVWFEHDKCKRGFKKGKKKGSFTSFNNEAKQNTSIDKSIPFFEMYLKNLSKREKRW